MARNFPRGSEWRKWDLHVHAPGTKLNDGYKPGTGQPPLARYCELLKKSDVQAFAIADYFSFDTFFKVRSKYREMFGQDEKLLLPNLELRHPVSVNRDGQNINWHLIFKPDLSEEEASDFLRSLKTEGTLGPNRRSRTCANLDTSDDFKSATVSHKSIEEAITNTFGALASSREARLEHLIVVCSAKGDGIRPSSKGSGKMRKALLSDELDKYSDAFFGNANNREYFLDMDRLETDEPVPPKPVFDGCDAHSFQDLMAKLGKHSTAEGNASNTTWIKADPTYEGLLQTLIEPRDRVRIQQEKPDEKEPYKVIERVTFDNPDNFPETIVLNPNLNSVIGSRSSGKSALLAYMAYSLDPEGTVQRQMDAFDLRDPKDAGPAAGLRWADVEDIKVQVHWQSGADTAGQVIYIPQNSLYRLSERPQEITQRIEPALLRMSPDFKVAYQKAREEARRINAAIDASVDTWMELDREISSARGHAREIGDKEAIHAYRGELLAKIEDLKESSALSDDEVVAYQALSSKLTEMSGRLEQLQEALTVIRTLVEFDDSDHPTRVLEGAVTAAITTKPSPGSLPLEASVRLKDVVEQHRKGLERDLEKVILEIAESWANEAKQLHQDVESLKKQNASLMERSRSDSEMNSLIEESEQQMNKLNEISELEQKASGLVVSQQKVGQELRGLLKERSDVLRKCQDSFHASERTLDDLSFGIEIDLSPEDVTRVSDPIHKNSLNQYQEVKSDAICLDPVRKEPEEFLIALTAGNLRLKKGFEIAEVAKGVLGLTEQIRFSATLDGDRIGGFGSSTMTPGKQALFALTLILNESQEPWPLLIDQPEDDLDSRSIYDAIVPYLIARKKERQIVMVTHNANLVVGADSESVIVANRHGDDRPNDGGILFDYVSGSLENSRTKGQNGSSTLSRCGIREHACEILDGGEEAFQKRRDKYKIRSAQ